MLLAAQAAGERPEKETTPTHGRKALADTGHGKVVAPLKSSWLLSAIFPVLWQVSASGIPRGHLRPWQWDWLHFTKPGLDCLRAAAEAGHVSRGRRRCLSPSALRERFWHPALPWVTKSSSDDSSA